MATTHQCASPYCPGRQRPASEERHPWPCGGAPILALGIDCLPVAPALTSYIARQWTGESDGAQVRVCELQHSGWLISVAVLVGVEWRWLFTARAATFEETHDRAREQHTAMLSGLRALEVAMTECEPPLLSAAAMDAFGLHVLVQRSIVDGVAMVDIDTPDEPDEDEPHLRIFVNDECLHEHPTIAEVMAEREARGACELCGAEPGDEHRRGCAGFAEPPADLADDEIASAADAVRFLTEPCACGHMRGRHSYGEGACLSMERGERCGCAGFTPSAEHTPLEGDPAVDPDAALGERDAEGRG